MSTKKKAPIPKVPVSILSELRILPINTTYTVGKEDVVSISINGAGDYVVEKQIVGSHGLVKDFITIKNVPVIERTSVLFPN